MTEVTYERLALQVGGVPLADGEHEVELGTYAHFAPRDRLTDVMLERMLDASLRAHCRAGRV